MPRSKNFQAEKMQQNSKTTYFQEKNPAILKKDFWTCKCVCYILACNVT